MSNDYRLTGQTFWSQPRQQGKSWFNDIIEDMAEQEAQRIDRKIMNTTPGFVNVMVDGKRIGKLESISFGDETACTRLVPKTKTVFCTHNSYNLNRKTLIL